MRQLESYFRNPATRQNGIGSNKIHEEEGFVVPVVNVGNDDWPACGETKTIVLFRSFWERLRSKEAPRIHRVIGEIFVSAAVELVSA